MIMLDHVMPSLELRLCSRLVLYVQAPVQAVAILSLAIHLGSGNPSLLHCQLAKEGRGLMAA